VIAKVFSFLTKIYSSKFTFCFLVATMTMPSNLSELARKGDPKAIATLMNRKLEPKGITAKAAARHGCLQIQLESEQTPNQAALVKFVQNGLDSLGAEGLNAVRIYGYQAGVSVPAWEEEINLSQTPTDETLSSTEANFSAETSFDQPIELVSEDDLQPAQKKSGRSRYLMAVIPAVIVGVVGLGLIIRHLFFEPKAIAPVTPIAASSSAPSSAPPSAPLPGVTPTATTAAPNANSFREAVNQATQAAVATQSATNTQQWQQVVSFWQQSIALLKQVPPGNANYQVAQQKIGEYQRNLSYAQQRLKTAAP
jgi:hypothetical protein